MRSRGVQIDNYMGVLQLPRKAGVAIGLAALVRFFRLLYAHINQGVPARCGIRLKVNLADSDATTFSQILYDGLS
ncbi:hypothetical protein GCM10010404_90610 [Nonomuraea africana]